VPAVPPDRSAAVRRRRADRSAVVLLALPIAFRPLSTDLHLPSLTGLAEHFAVSPAAVPATLSICIGTFAPMQQVAAPLSDRFGRRPVALGGVGTFLAGSAPGAMAGSPEVLLAARVLQAVGACCTVVCARAILRDRYDPAMGARRLSRATSGVALMPIAAPVVGEPVFAWLGGRSAFRLMAGFALLAPVACTRLPRESNLRPDPTALRPGPMLVNDLAVLRLPAWLGFTLIGASVYRALFAFLSESAFAFGVVYGMSPTAFGLAVSDITTGLAQNLAGATGGALAGVMHDGSMLPIGVMAATGSLAATLVAHTLVRRHGGVDRPARLAPAGPPAAG
jgi:DHA1 family bicyclomycin/chloramphenicol resistance-like MFS transporter